MKMQYCLILFAALIFAGCKKKNNLYVIFDRVDGLTEGSNVVVKGLNVGYVKSLELAGKKVICEIELKKDMVIPTGSAIFIQSNPLQNSYVDIEPSDSSTNIVAGDTVTGVLKKTAMLDNLLSDSASKAKIGKSLDKIIEVLDSVRISIKDSTAKR